jgi:hypothetical protein
MENWRDAYRAYRVLVWKPEGNLKDPSRDRRIILKLVFNQWGGSMDRKVLAQNRDAVTNLRFP